MASNLPIQPLQGQFKITDPETGLPTQEFLLYMKAIYDLLPSQEDAIAAIEGAGLTPSSARILLGANTRFGDEIEIDADTQAILNVISNVQGSILYRGATEWASLAPGTAGHFLRTAGAGANPTWAAAGGGGGGLAWALVAEWDGAVDAATASFEVTDLDPYDELLIILDRVGTVGNTFRRVRVSTDNGSSFYNTSGDYLQLNTGGGTTSRDSLSRTGSSFSSGASLSTNIVNMKGPVKRTFTSGDFNHVHFVADTNDINAIAVISDGVNMNSGNIYVYGR